MLRFQSVVQIFRRDTLLRRMLIVYGTAVLAITAATIAVAAFWIIPHFQQLEAHETRHRMEIVRQAFLAEMDRLSDLTRTWAVWDDAHAFALGRNSSFTQANYTPEALQQLGLSAVLILDRRDRILYSTTATRTRDNTRLLLIATGAAIGSPQLLAQTPNRVRAAVITAPGEAALISVADIARSDGSGQSPGRMVFVRNLDATILARIQERTNTPLQLHIGDSAFPAETRFRAKVTLADAYERPSLSVFILGKQNVIALGHHTLRTLAILFVGFLLLLAAIVARILVQTVIDPVRDLVVDVGEGPDWKPDGGSGRAPAPVEILKLRQAFEDAFVRVRQEMASQRLAAEDAAKANTIAEEASHAKSRFLAQMSHELRTPLNAIIGYSELLDEEWEEAHWPQGLEDVQIILTSARHLMSLVDEVLALSNLESGRATLVYSAVQIEDIVHSAANQIQPQVHAQNAHLELDLEPNLGIALVDERKILQILMHLLSNAVKFAPGGRIVLSARRGCRNDEQLIVFSVSDDGVGMSSDQLTRAFEPFAQAEANTHLKYGGIGLGLSITRALVKVLSGTLSIESELGHGTKVSILLPIAAKLVTSSIRTTAKVT